MLRSRFVFASLVLLLAIRFSTAADPPAPALTVAEGKVQKAGKDSLTIQPRSADGKFGKAVTLKITGTSKVTTISVQERGGKPVLVQRDTEVKDLEANQAIALIYASAKEGNVLLSAVVQPSGDK